MGGQQLRRSKANSPTSRALTPARVWCVTPGKIQSVFEPTGRANARPMTGSVDTGSHSNQVYADCVDLSAVENAPKQKDRAPFRFNRNEKGSSVMRSDGGHA